MRFFQATGLDREASAILRADLMTCGACTLEGLRRTAVAALAAVYQKPQRLTVRRTALTGDRVVIRGSGPDFFGIVELQAPGCD